MMGKKISKFVLCAIAIAVCCVGCSSESKLARDCTETFNADNWQVMVGSETGIWVSIGQQQVFLINNKHVVKQYRCSTALAGAGSLMDSGKTPLGWHKIGAKIGDGLETGAVLKDREWTGAVWQSGDDTEDDLILSRVLWLEGLQEGKNRGGNVDSWNRYIYIHGTNAVNDLGRPASAGCIRLDPREVIDLYERVEVGTKVLVTVD